MRKIVLLLFLLAILLVMPVNGSALDRYESAYYPMADLNILNINSNNSFTLAPGKVYAPFTAVVKRTEGSFVWFESKDPVRLTTDNIMYITMLIQFDKSSHGFSERQVVIQGDLMYDAKSSIRIELAGGTYGSQTWTYSNNIWTQGKGLVPSEVFWINPLVKIVDDKGMIFLEAGEHDPYSIGIYQTIRVVNNREIIVNPSFNTNFCLSYSGSSLRFADSNDINQKCVFYQEGEDLYRISIDNRFLVVDRDKVNITFGEGSLFRIRKQPKGYIITWANNENMVLTYQRSGAGYSVMLSEYRGTSNQLWWFNGITNPVFSSILLNTKPYITEYSDEIITDGLTLKEIYNDGTYTIISEGFTLFEEEKKVTVAYRNKTVFFHITRTRPQDELIILNNPDKQIYLIGERIDKTGLEVAVRHADGQIESIGDYYFRLYNLNTEGVHEIGILYGGMAAYFKVLVVRDEIRNIKIKSLPETEYYLYDELDTGGLSIEVEYADGTFSVIDRDFAFYPEIFMTTGEIRINVTYAGKSTDFNVNVKPLEVKDMQIKSLPKRLVYGLNEELVTDGLTIAVRLNNGSIMSVTGGFDIYGFDSGKPGKKTVTVSYAGKRVTFEVDVIDSKVDKIEIRNYPNGSELTGLTVNLIYTNGEIVYISSGFDISYEPASEGYTNVIVKYLDHTARFKLPVQDKEIAKINVMNYPKRMHYRMFEEFNPSGLVLKVYYKDGTFCEITTGYTLSYDFSRDPKVTVKYKGFETDFDVIPVYTEPDSLIVRYKRYTAYVDRPFDKNLLEVIAQYDDGTSYYLEDYDMEFNPSQEGIYKVKVSFGTLSNSFDVVALDNRIIRIYVVGYPKDKAYEEGDIISNSDVVVKALYHDGTEEYINGFDLTYDFSTDSKVIVSYMGYTTYFKVNLKHNGSAIRNRLLKPMNIFIIAALAILLLFVIYMVAKWLIKKNIEKSVDETTENNC